MDETYLAIHHMPYTFVWHLAGLPLLCRRHFLPPSHPSLLSAPYPGLVALDRTGKGGEEVGDALRACTSWSQGFSAAGATADISMFAGSIKLRKSIFDCTLAPWEKVVEALTSNTAERSKTVTLIFEREVE